MSLENFDETTKVSFDRQVRDELGAALRSLR
jgi:hypothetical protein